MAIYPSNGKVRFGDYESEVIELNPFLGMGEVLVARDTGSAKMGPGHWNDLPTLGAAPAAGGGGGGVSPITTEGTGTFFDVTEGTMFDFTIPEATLADSGAGHVDWEVYGTIFNTSSSPQTFTYRLKVAGSTAVTHAVVLASDSAPRTLAVQGRILGLNTTGVLRLVTIIDITEPAALGTAAVLDAASSARSGRSLSREPTLAHDISFTAQSTHADAWTTVSGARALIIPPA